MIAFEPHALAAGFGHVWAVDPRWPALVRLDPESRVGELHVSLASHYEGGAGGPGLISVGLGRVWLACGDRLVAVDPVRRESQAWDLPFRAGAVAAGGMAAFVIGGWGNGELLAVRPDGTLTAKTVGESLGAVAAAEGLVWVFDDAPGELVALDAATLERVRTFARLGTPGMIVARGDEAWHLSHRERRFSPPGQRQVRVSAEEATGAELVRVNARTGEISTAVTASGSAAPQMVLDGETLWITGTSSEPSGLSGGAAGAADPSSQIFRYELRPARLSEICVPGQALAVAAIGDQIWVSDFRRTQQQVVVNVYTHDGAPVGKADLSGIDMSPWWTPPAPPPAIPISDLAEQTRAAVEENLRTAREVNGRFGDRWTEPPISKHFTVEAVSLNTSQPHPRLTITFQWSPYRERFAVSYSIDPDDDTNWASTPDEFASAILIDLEERLRAAGYGIANARRQARDGLVYLTWRDDP